MARTHPDIRQRPPIASAGEQAEFEVLQHLADGLPDSFDCFHGFAWSWGEGASPQQAEVDIVVVSPEGHLVLLTVQAGELAVLLSHRKEAPHKGRWGLPGGVLRIDLDESLEACAERVGVERLGLTVPNLQLVTAVGSAKRDPRAPWAMSVVYRSLLGDALPVTPGKRVQALSEAVLGRALDKVTLRRRLEAAGCVVAIEGAMRGGAHRPAQVYRVVAG